MTTLRAVAVVLLVVLVAGCGGSEKIDPNFVRTADAICKRQRAEIQRIAPPANQAMPAIARYLTNVLPVVKRNNRALHQLELPKVHADLWRQLLGQHDAYVTQVERMLAAARGRARLVYDVASNRLATTDQQFLQTAHDIGLVTCAVPGS